jgi:DNA-directed RNA polymerase specialized sigma24 family protein
VHVPSGTVRKLELSYSQYVPRAFLFAFLITLDEHLSERLALRGFRRSMGTLQDLRGADMLEVRVLRSVVSGAQRARLVHRKASDDAITATWLHLPVVARATLVLRFLDDTDHRRIADILECSDATVTSLTNKAFRRLGRNLGHTDHQDLLTAWLKRQEGDAPAAPPQTERLRRGVGVRRVLTMIGALIGALLLVAGAVVGATTAVRRASSRPQPAVDKDPGPIERASTGILDELKLGCPAAKWLLPPPEGAAREAAEIAVLFNKAVIRGDEFTIRELTEPTAKPTRGSWASTTTARGIRVASSQPVSKEDIFTRACGRQVTRHSMRVVIHDRSGVNEGLAFFYLGYTPEGWLVWAAHDPGIS